MARQENSLMLLVDDEPAYAQIMRAMAAAMGHGLDHVADPAEVFEALARRRYALILMDIEMPGVDGFQTTAAIRSLGGWMAEVPIIAFTTLGRPEDADRYISAGMDGVLPKPFGIVESVATLRQWLPEATPPKTLRESLIALLGKEAADAMVARFYVALDEAVEAVEAGGDMRRIGHKIGGLAGTLGFGVLSAAWLALQDGAADTWPTVRQLSRDALSRDRGQANYDNYVTDKQRPNGIGAG